MVITPEQLVDLLEEMADRSRDQTTAWVESGSIILRGAKNRAPVDTGALKASMQVKTRNRGMDLVFGVRYAVFVDQVHPTNQELDQVEQILVDYVEP